MSDVNESRANSDFEWDDEGDAPDLAIDSRGHSSQGCWKVAIIDDDQDVHDATHFALQDVEILQRPLQLLHAYSAAEGLELLGREQDVAVALVDVVMETPSAGLELIETVRANGMCETRIILRTGQPGYAPELSVLQQYDINDYRTKTELTNLRLMSALTTAIRSYRQITTINEIRKGLELIVDGISDLFCHDTLELFARGVLIQVAGLLQSPADGLVCAAGHDPQQPVSAEAMRVLYDRGSFAGHHGRALSEVEVAEVRQAYEAASANSTPYSVGNGLGLRYRSRYGYELFVYLRTRQPISDTDYSLLRVFSSNIALSFEKVKLVERLDQLAYRDQDLDLHNSNGFDRAITQLPMANATPWSFALVRIRGLDVVIGGYGMERAKEYLRTIVDQARSFIPGLALMARIEQDLFAVAFDQRQASAETVHRAFSSSAVLDEVTLPVAATVAILKLDPGQEVLASTVNRCLRTALIAAEQDTPGGVYRYSPELSTRIQRRLTLQSALLRTLASGTEFSIMLQPKVDMASGAIVGAEALARWRTDSGPVSPAEFVPIVEASGLARMLRDRVIDEVGDWTRRRKHQGLSTPPIAINLSLCDLAEPHFANSLLMRVRRAGLCPQTLHFELTESAMMHSLESTRKELLELREAGYAIAVDDFGTGYSSLSYLEHLPITSLKIDRSFVEPLLPENASRSLAGCTVAMAHQLGLEVVAEGVETGDQHEALLALGCSVAQGYLYSPPVHSAQFPTYG